MAAVTQADFLKAMQDVQGKVTEVQQTASVQQIAKEACREMLKKDISRWLKELFMPQQQKSWTLFQDYRGQNGRCTIIIENSQIGMSRHLDSSTKTQMAKIMVQYGRSGRSTWAKSVWSSFGRTVMGKVIWENLFWNTVGRWFPIVNAYSYTVKKDHSHLSMWMSNILFCLPCGLVCIPCLCHAH